MGPNLPGHTVLVFHLNFFFFFLLLKSNPVRTDLDFILARLSKSNYVQIHLDLLTNWTDYSECIVLILKIYYEVTTAIEQVRAASVVSFGAARQACMYTRQEVDLYHKLAS